MTEGVYAVGRTKTNIPIDREKEKGKVMIKIGIVEDENSYADLLGQYLERYQKEEETELRWQRFCDGDEIVNQYSGTFDILLMDIQMKFMDGMSAAEEIRKMDQKVIIIFITNMTGCAIRGYEVGALDYIVKPVEYFSFSQKLKRAIRKVEQEKEHHIYLSMEDGLVKLGTNEVYYIESQGHSLRFHTKRGMYLIRGNMQKQEETLEPYGFFRIHKGYLVNLYYIDEIKGNDCMVRNNWICISRKKKRELMEKMVDCMQMEVR